MVKSTGSARKASTTASKNSKEGRPVLVHQDQALSFDAMIACLKEERAQYRAAMGLALVRSIAVQVGVSEQLERSPQMIERLRKHEFFKRMRIVPEEAHELVAQLALYASTPDQRVHASRYGRAIRYLRSRGESAGDIATRLAGLGGILTMLTSARLEELGLPPELDGEPTSKRITRRKSHRAAAERTGRRR